MSSAFHRVGYKFNRSYLFLPNLAYGLVSHRYSRTLVGACVLSYFVYSQWGITRSSSHMRLVPDKLWKYLPIEAGGNILFPISILIELGLKSHPATRWNSFDQRSFFPHSEVFKIKVGVVESNLPLLKAVLDRQKVHVDAPVIEESSTPAIGLAAMLGRTEVIEYLRDRGSDINCQDKYGSTPVMLAVVHQQEDAVKLLAEAGADLSIVDKYGFTVMDKARKRGYTELADHLESYVSKPAAPIININPVTPTLEQYAFLNSNSCQDIATEYNPRRHYIGLEYPFYRRSQGFLICLFGNYTLPDLAAYLEDWTEVNPRDEKVSTDQQLFSFGKVISETMEKVDQQGTPSQ